MRARFALFMAILATSLAGLVPMASSVSAATSHYYVALGDSYPYGYQPNGDWSNGYTDQLTTQLQQLDHNMTLVNMACWGETTDTFINGGCIGPNNGIPTKVTYSGSPVNQLTTAANFVSANGPAVKLVTLDVGLNDIAYNCFNAHTGSVNYTCVSKELPIIQAHELYILSTLKSVASSATKFMIANSLGPVQNFLPNSILAVQEYNQMIQNVSQQSGVPMVDVAASFHLNDYPNGGNPYLCDNGAPLLWACINGDTHPTTAGYTVIANAFYDKYLSL